MRNFGYSEKGRVGSLGDTRIWARILPLCRGELHLLLPALLLSLLVTGSMLGLPRLLQLGIDGYILPGDMETADRIQGLGRMALLYGSLVGVIFLGGFSQVVLLERVGQRIMHLLRNRLFSHLLGLEIDYFSRRPVGRLVTRLTNDIQNMHEMFTSVLVTLFNDLLRLVGILVALYLMNVRLALVMTVYLPLALAMTGLFSRLARERFRVIRSRLAGLNGFLNEMISNMAVVQLYGREQHLGDRYARLTREYMEATFAQIRLFGTFLPMTELMGTSAVAVILLYGGSLVLDGRLTLGELVAFLSYMRLFFQPLRELSQKYSIVQSALASAERIFDLLDTRPAMQVHEPVRHTPPMSGAMRIQEVDFSYTSGEPVLRGIDLSLAPATVTALVGATGSGKSTLANLLVRFHDPERGRILLDGTDLRNYPLHVVRRAVGIIMQEVLILPDTVRANIRAGSSISDADLEDLVRETGLESLVERLPDGLETRIGEGGVELSAGEKQLLSFIRVLARNPALLIFDEATAAVDTESEQILQGVVERGFADRTVLVIAHRLSTVRRADTILVMDGGRIVEQGSHGELLRRNGLYARLVEVDLRSSSGAVKKRC